MRPCSQALGLGFSDQTSTGTPLGCCSTLAGFSSIERFLTMNERQASRGSSAGRSTDHEGGKSVKKAGPTGARRLKRRVGVQAALPSSTLSAYGQQLCGGLRDGVGLGLEQRSPGPRSDRQPRRASVRGDLLRPGMIRTSGEGHRVLSPGADQSRCRPPVHHEMQELEPAHVASDWQARWEGADQVGVDQHHGRAGIDEALDELTLVGLQHDQDLGRGGLDVADAGDKSVDVDRVVLHPRYLELPLARTAESHAVELFGPVNSSAKRLAPNRCWAGRTAGRRADGPALGGRHPCWCQAFEAILRDTVSRQS